VIINDKYNNPVEQEFYDVNFEILGDGLLFLDNNLKTLKTTTFE
jgi:hypothetical protein